MSQGMGPGQKNRSTMLIEALEPRILYSADVFGGTIDSPATDDPVVTLLDDTTAMLEKQVVPLQSTESQKEQTDTALTEILPENDDENVTSSLTEASTRLELVFIDTDTPDYQQLVDDMLSESDDSRHLEIIILDNEHDGIDQISDVLQSYQGVDAIHIISHGEEGSVDLGNTHFNSEKLPEYQQELQSWSQHLDADADILFYGCNLAASVDGQFLIGQIAELTGADVAASSDLTGSDEFGGDWELEYQTGVLETQVTVSVEAQRGWSGLLAETIYTSYENAPDVSEVKSDTDYGQTFSYNSGNGTYNVNQLSLQMSRDADTTLQNVTVSLRASWDGPDLAGGAISSASLTTSMAWQAFDIGNVSLNDGDTYYLRVTSDSMDGKIWLGADSSGTYANGEMIDVNGLPLGGEDLTFRVAETNVAPVLVGANNLTVINEDDVANAGTLVSDLIAGQVTDADAGSLEGIAVIGVDDTNGTWEYTTNGGSNWLAFGSPDATSARLLVSDASTYVRFVPDANWNGTVTSGITFHAWDQTSGSNGGVADIGSTLRDEFSSVVYNNSDGSDNWTTTWIENDRAGGGAASGDYFVDPVLDRLQFSEKQKDRWIYREADLSSATAATFSFVLDSNLNASGDIAVQVSGNGGGSFTTLTNIVQATPNGKLSFDITGYIASNTQIRFYDIVGGGKEIFIDDVQITISDQVGGSTAFSSSAETASITVNAINDAPVATAEAQYTNEDTVLNEIVPEATDVDGTIASYTLGTDVAQGSLTFNNDGSYSFDPGSDFDDLAPGATRDVTFTYTATDNDGGVSGAATVTITVSGTNDAPTVANLVPDQVATEDSTFSYQFAANTFNDVDGDSLTYTSDASGWLSFDAATRTFSGTPLNADVGTTTVTVTADDGNGGTVSDTFDIVISNTNDAPTVSNLVPDPVASEDSAFSFQFAANTFNDVDGDSLSYTSDAAGWLSFDAATRTFSGTPLNGDVGTTTVTVTADDGNGGTVSDTFDIVISNTNDAPTVANLISDQVATEDSAFSFQFAANTFNDVDGDSLTYTSDAAGWLSFDAATRTFSGTPLNGDVGTTTVTVTADDSNGGTVSDTFDIVISNTNDAPTVANLVPDQVATEDSAFRYQFAANTFNDVDGDSLSYTSDAAGWLSFDAATRTFSGTPLNGDVGTTTVTVTADDGNGGTVSDTFDIVISNTNDAPTVANLISDQVASEDSAFSYQFAANTFNDVDGDSLTYTSDASGWLSFDAATRTFSGTPLNADVGTTTVTVTADDGNGGTVSDTFDIVISNTNDAPTVANLMPDQIATEDSAFSYQFAANTFHDVDGDSLSYSSDAAGWLSFDAATRTFSGTPLNADVGTTTVTVTADDGNGGTVSDTFDIVISNTNDAPTVANLISDQVASEDSAFSYQFAANTFNDVDGDSLSYTSDASGWLSFDAATRTFSGIPLNADVGTTTVTVTADDGNGGTVSDTFDIVISNTNDAPTVANPISDQVATEDSVFSYQFAANTFNDVDGDSLTYTSDASGWLSFDAATRIFSGTPLNADVGTTTVTLTADDGNGGTVSDTFDIVISNTNDAPTVANLISDQVATEDSAFSYQFAANTFNDVDGDSLSYTSDASGWLSFDAATRTVSGTPLNADVGTTTVTVTADDGNGGTVSDTFDIVISNTNDAPTVANLISDQVATEDAVFSYQFAANTFNDVDGDSLTYTSDASGWLSFDAATRTFSGTPLNGDVGTTTVTVTADDGNGGTVSDTFDIVISNTNDAPTVANLVPDQVAIEDSAFSYQFAANTFNDVDGDSLSYTSDASGWLSFDAATRTFSGTPLNADVGTTTVTVTADDGNGGTVSDTFDIVISNTNDAPTVANLISDLVATEDSAFSYQFAANTFNDIDGDSLTYNSDASGWLSFDAATRTFSGTPLNADVGTTTVTVTADDGNGGTVSDTFDIVISNTNDAPTAANLMPDQVATEDAAFSYQFAANSFNDVDGDSLTYTSDASGWLSFDAATRTFSGTPLNGDVGTTTVTVTADDGNGGTVSDTFDIVISNTNDAPTVANLVPDQVATEDVVFSYQFTSNSFNDVDGDSLTYTSDASGWLSFDAATRTFSGTPLNADVGTTTVTVTADDGNGGTVSDTFDIVISNTNDAPSVANLISDQVATEDSAFSYQFAANTFNDVDGDSLSYTSDASGWLSFDAATRTFSGTPLNGDVGTTTVTVTADDGNGGTVSDTFDIVISNPNGVPVIGGVYSGEVTEDIDPDNDMLLETTGTMTIVDPDIGESSFVAGTISGSYGNLSIDAAGNWSYAADNTQAAVQQLDPTEVLIDTLVVTTNDGSTQAVTITINGVGEVIIDPGSESDEDEDDQDSEVSDGSGEDTVDEELTPEEVIALEEALVDIEEDPGLRILINETVELYSVNNAELASVLADVERDSDHSEYQELVVEPIPEKFIDLRNLNIASFELEGIEPIRLKPHIDNDSFVNSLEEMNRDLDVAMEKEEEHFRLEKETAIGVTVSFSVGLISWVFRAGSFLACFMSVAPLWKQFDPLPVLGDTHKNQKKDEEGTEEDSRVENIFKDGESD